MIAAEPAGQVFTEIVLEIFRLNRALLDAGDVLTAPAGLSSARWQVLGVVEHGPVTVADVARRMGLTRQSVLEAANALAAEGFVDWHDNPRHRRAKLMRLTAKGRRAMKVVTRRHAEWANAIGRAHDRGALRAALHTLRSLSERLEGGNMNAQPETTATEAHAQARQDSPMGLVLHVSDIAAASRFYQSIGFEQTAAYPGADGELTVAFLVQGSSTLLLGRRDQLHYENPQRARQVRRGPHGLGVVITLLVPDLERVYQTVRAAGLAIQMEPADEFYGDRVFMFLDADGYEWKVSQTIASVSERDVAAAIAAH